MTERKRYLPMATRSCGCSSPPKRKWGERIRRMKHRSIGKHSPPCYLRGEYEQINHEEKNTSCLIYKFTLAYIFSRVKVLSMGFIKCRVNFKGLGVDSSRGFGGAFHYLRPAPRNFRTFFTPFRKVCIHERSFI